MVPAMFCQRDGSVSYFNYLTKWQKKSWLMLDGNFNTVSNNLLLLQTWQLSGNRKRCSKVARNRWQTGDKVTTKLDSRWSSDEDELNHEWWIMVAFNLPWWQQRQHTAASNSKVHSKCVLSNKLATIVTRGRTTGGSRQRVMTELGWSGGTSINVPLKENVSLN